LRRQVELDAFEMGPAEMERFTGLLTRLRPRAIRGYASALALYARFLEERGRPFPPPAGVISCAETLTDPMREAIEAGLGAPVHDRYGSREFGVIASQCEAGRYHINTRGAYVEILDGSRPASPGTVGRVVVTGLACRAMPLIRYETGDIAEAPAEESCPCGRGLPLMGGVYGRASDFVATSDGRLVHGEFFTHLFYGRQSVREFALVQDETGTLLLTVVGDGPALERELAQVVDEVRARMGPGAKVMVNRVDRIDLPPSGKRHFVRSEAAAARWAAGGVIAGEDSR
jgi:phenylacetate-CoA ligase